MRCALARPRVVHHVARHRESHTSHRVSHVTRVTADQPSTSGATMSQTGDGPRVFCTSDIHTDFPENMQWCNGLSDVNFLKDAIILGGDVSDDMQVLEQTLRIFKSKFKHVFFTPGNHDLWHKGKGQSKSDDEAKNDEGTDEEPVIDSMEKLERVLRLCDTCGVLTKPTLLKGTPGVWVVPVLAWHHSSFDTEPDIPDDVKVVPPPEKVMSDFRLCKWPSPLNDLDESVARALDDMNDTRQEWKVFLDALENGTPEERNAEILSFSHFLPRLELCPEKRMLFYPNLPKAVGSDFILPRIEKLASLGVQSGQGEGLESPEGKKPKVQNPKANNPALRKHVHIFGHTHFGWDQTLENIRYVQAPVSYPHEWKQRPGSLTVGPDSRGVEFDLSPEVTGETDDIVRVMEPLCIWDAQKSSGSGGETDHMNGDSSDAINFGFVQEMRARWSDHYKTNPREPDNTELAWWVKGGRKSS